MCIRDRLAAVPLSEKDKPLIKEMEQTAFSAELTRAAEGDGQLAQLQGLQAVSYTHLDVYKRQTQQHGAVTHARLQFAMTFWHDLAAPILAGIITAAIVSWWRNRK